MALRRLRSCLTQLQLTTSQRNFARLYPTYKSKYSIENIYPHSDQNFLRRVEFKHTYSNDIEEEFTGYIPLDEISIKAVRGSGPGGQNVNKVSTKVEVRFHVESADWIPKWIKENLVENEKSRITKDGYFVVTSEKTRNQMLNQADCLAKIREMVFNSSKKPVEMTEEYKQVLQKRFKRANMVRLRRKREHKLKKFYRSNIE
ncbi:large ribosomal subunit protein mL62-like [Crassostrea virginica]|uniref:Large ribosomal subunit protein mL62 n=1 Tax=Crassostrea virginica TaxID=6565 RepID=A0A8B8CLU5_CRAVI|nr:peptidyl-tRNA hydrolase ICT1, mitochondrial-like [Crassostrea virginica]